jgi:hypothetical protein
MLGPLTLVHCTTNCVLLYAFCFFLLPPSSLVECLYNRLVIVAYLGIVAKQRKN